MLFNSFSFLLFFPIVILIYFILPNKYRLKNVWLLISSYYFYACNNLWYAIIIFSITIFSYIVGILMNIVKQKRQRKNVLIFGIIILILTLFTFKFLNNFTDFILVFFNKITGNDFMRSFNIILPVGISFYLLQAISYVIDVYKNKVNYEKNFIKYALYISFFPQLVAGPIERADQFISQIDIIKKFDYDRMKKGLLIMLAGFFQKLVIADRAAIFVNNVYSDISSFSGITIIITTFIFGIQIYCDFAGYSNIAIGAAEVLGFKLNKNFDMPYASTSISDFWRKWHITFSTWLKDYVYIPLGGNKCSKARNYFNLLITFIISGFWHGTSINFAIWGFINGILIVIEKLVKELKIKIPKFISCFLTYILINFTWLFFRAESFQQIIELFDRIFNSFNIKNVYQICSNAGESIEFLVLIIATIIMNILTYINKRKDIIAWIFKKNIVIRWSVYYIFIFVILIFGIYGIDAANTEFIYMKF